MQISTFSPFTKPKTTEYSTENQPKFGLLSRRRGIEPPRPLDPSLMTSPREPQEDMAAGSGSNDIPPPLIPNNNHRTQQPVIAPRQYQVPNNRVQLNMVNYISQITDLYHLDELMRALNAQAAERRRQLTHPVQPETDTGFDLQSQPSTLSNSGNDQRMTVFERFRQLIREAQQVTDIETGAPPQPSAPSTFRNGRMRTNNPFQASMSGPHSLQSSEAQPNADEIGRQEATFLESRESQPDMGARQGATEYSESETETEAPLHR